MMRASVVGADATYEMFDVASLDRQGARLVGPLLLEIGEEVTLRLVREGIHTDVRARVAKVERGAAPERVAVTVVTFLAEASEPPAT